MGTHLLDTIHLDGGSVDVGKVYLLRRGCTGIARADTVVRRKVCRMTDGAWTLGFEDDQRDEAKQPNS